VKTVGAYSKPLEALSLTGAIERNPARFADRGNTPAPENPIGDPPASFTDDQKAIWNELIIQCAPGVLFGSDRVVLELCVRLIGKMRTSKLNGAEMSVLMSALQQLGMTPVSRSRITVAKSNEASIWDDILSSAPDAKNSN